MHRLMRFLLQLGCLFVPGVFSGAQAAIVFMSLEDRGLDFHSGPDFYLKIPLDFVPGDGSLWLAPGSHALSTGHLISQGAVRRSEEHTSELQSREKLVCRLRL